jgi:sarcosine oxidase/L-pipecolate oxidase
LRLVTDFWHRPPRLQLELTFQEVQLFRMAPSRAKTSVIVVGGGGTIGSSTALHLLRSGYTPSNITVLDTYPIPSAQSAGNDLNKIMGIRLRNKVDLQLSLEARQMWKEDELFKEYFHNTGRVSSTYFEIRNFMLIEVVA